MDIVDAAVGQSGIRNYPAYRAYVDAYRAADALYWYIFERWRNEPDLYDDYCKPVCDNRYGVHFELA